MQPSNRALTAALHEFRHDAFRPAQERCIRALLDGRDVLAVLPTGFGKSLVYQVAAQLLDGVTLVVSPLLALMRDQEEAIEALGLAVSTINSRQSAAETAAELAKVRAGEAKLLYVTPERFENVDFMAMARELTVSLFVVDEAHCISEWGHDFRPAYLGLAAAAALGRPPLLTLTATASPWVREEIVDRLDLRSPEVVVRGTDRPNLWLEVRRVDSEEEELDLLRALLSGEGDEAPGERAPTELAAALGGSGIIYTATTKGARQTAERLRAWGIAADYYHGQRRRADRERVQTQFMEGALRVIAATNAFGLGVDKPDIRFVIHRDIPASLEGYFQEAGRAGLDGALARCTLLYRPAALGRAAFLAGSGQLTRADVARAQRGLATFREGTARQAQAASGLSKTDFARLLAILKQEGLVRERRGRLHLLRPDFDPDTVPLAAEERRHAYERSRLEMMRGYAETIACRRKYLLNYFGEDLAGDRCERCDNDWRQPVEPAAPDSPAPFTLHERVRHGDWGSGVVQRVAGDTVTILFDDAGYKTLAADFAKEAGLLREESAG